jgi:catechol 2,3-dioxygenase-like lactoylglutathione lyase family enzyme
MQRYHHLGIPTEEPHEDEEYLEEFRCWVRGYGENPYGIEWMRFAPDSPLPELVQRVPHVAFEVDDLEAAIEGHEILVEPNSPSPEVRVAFIISDGAPVEFLEIEPAAGRDQPAEG